MIGQYLIAVDDHRPEFKAHEFLAAKSHAPVTVQNRTLAGDESRKRQDEKQRRCQDDNCDRARHIEHALQRPANRTTRQSDATWIGHNFGAAS